MIPDAREMAAAIVIVANKLIAVNVLDAESHSALGPLSSSLQKQGSAQAWRYEVARTPGFRFRRLRDECGEAYTPVVSVDGIDVSDRGEKLPPIMKLDISLELRYEHAEDRTLRWHFDQANRDHQEKISQPGPLFHLQFGGRVHKSRTNDMPLSVPRWNHPPMDLILLLETVTANFFQKEWFELREDVTWCRQIRLCERLYLLHYQRWLTAGLEVSNGTLLKRVWGDCWWD